jgi:hypothetical protein
MSFRNIQCAGGKRGIQATHRAKRDIAQVNFFRHSSREENVGFRNRVILVAPARDA